MRILRYPTEGWAGPPNKEPDEVRAGNEPSQVIPGVRRGITLERERG